MIEHKSGDAATCARLLRERDLINRVIVMSFDWAYLREFHELEPEQVLGALGPPIRFASGRRPLHLRKRFGGAWFKDIEKTAARLVVWNRQVPPRAIQLAHQRGWKVWVYTVNDPRHGRKLLDAGVDGLITNRIETLKPVVRAHGTSTTR